MSGILHTDGNKRYICNSCLLMHEINIKSLKSIVILLFRVIVCNQQTLHSPLASDQSNTTIPWPCILVCIIRIHHRDIRVYSFKIKRTCQSFLYSLFINIWFSAGKLVINSRKFGISLPPSHSGSANPKRGFCYCLFCISEFQVYQRNGSCLLWLYILYCISPKTH